MFYFLSIHSKQVYIVFCSLPGAHKADTFADIIVNYLKKYNLTNELTAMTANKVGTNTGIGQVISLTDSIDFNHHIQVHGCVAHVINLAAKEGLKAFGQILDTDN